MRTKMLLWGIRHLWPARLLLALVYLIGTGCVTVGVYRPTPVWWLLAFLILGWVCWAWSYLTVAHRMVEETRAELR